MTLRRGARPYVAVCQQLAAAAERTVELCARAAAAAAAHLRSAGRQRGQSGTISHWLAMQVDAATAGVTRPPHPCQRTTQQQQTDVTTYVTVSVRLGTEF